MKSSTMLRWCLVLEWVFILVGMATAFALESSLPAPLAAWLKGEADSDLTSGQFVLVALGIPLIVSMIVATIGLLCLRRWAAWLYLITTVLEFLIMPFTGPTVEHALADALEQVATVLSGIVIALAFFTDSLKKRTAEQNPPPLPRGPQAGQSEGEG